MDSHTPLGLPRAVHPDLSPAQNPDDLDRSLTTEESAVIATGPFKVYSPGLGDWEPGIDLREDAASLALTTPAGHHAYSGGRFTVEVSPDGRIVWILGDAADASSADGHPPVTVLMPASLDELGSRMPGVEFSDLDEAAHTIRRLTAAAAAGRHTRHRFGLQRSGDMGLIVDPVEGEPVLGLLRITDAGMEFRSGGVWESGSPADRIAPFTSIVPVARGAVARFDHLERSPSMSLSLFDRFVLFESRFLTSASTAPARTCSSRIGETQPSPEQQPAHVN